MELVLSSAPQRSGVLNAADVLSALIILDRNATVTDLTIDLDTFPVERLIPALQQRFVSHTLPVVSSVTLHTEGVVGQQLRSMLNSLFTSERIRG